MAKNWSLDVIWNKVSMIFWFTHPSSQHCLNIPAIALVLSTEFSIRLTITRIILAYVWQSALNPKVEIELKVEAAICKAFLFSSSLPMAVAHVFRLFYIKAGSLARIYKFNIAIAYFNKEVTHSILNDTSSGSSPIASIVSNNERTWVTLSGSSQFEMQDAVALKVTFDGLQLLFPFW